LGSRISAKFRRVLSHPAPIRSPERVFIHQPSTHIWPMGSGPMPKHDEYKEIARAVLAHTAGLLGLAEWWLRRANQLDYVVRRRLIPVPFEKATRSMPRKEASIRRIGLSSDIQDAIGQRLRAQYAVEQSMPARLNNLLREFEH